MKFVTTATYQILDDGKWVNIGVFPQRILAESPVPEIETYEVPTFKDLQEFANQFYGMWNETTFFIHRPCVRIQFGVDFTATITEKNFDRSDPPKFRIMYERFDPTMKWLVNNLTAEDFAQYAKDRGWNNIVIIK